MAADTVSLKIKLVDEATGAVKAVTAQVEGMNQALGKATEGTRQMGEEAKKTVDTMFQWSLVGESLGKLSGIISGLTAPSKAFNDAMRKANTMAGLSEEQFQEMKKSIRAISKEVPMSADALAEGLYSVVSNGFDASEQLGVLKASARSAIGGCADLSSVIGVTATMLKNYGLSGDYAADIQDKIQLTAKNGVTSFEELAGSLPMVSGSAATLGVSIDELMASFSTLTGVSGNTANVATQMGAVFNSLISPTSEATKTAQLLGIEFNAAAIKSAGGLQQFLTNTVDAVNAYCQRTGALEAEVYGQLFGNARALRALIPLTGELSEKYGQNVEAMVNSTGTMDAAFDQMSKTSSAKAQSYANKWGDITDFMLEHLGSVVSMIQKTMAFLGGISSTLPALKMLNTQLRLSSLATKLWAVTTTLARGALTATTARLRAFGAAIARTTVAQKIATAATSAWAVAQKVLNFIMTMNPIGLIIAAIGLLVAAVFGVIQAFRKWGDEALLIFGPIGSLILAFKTHWESIKQAFTDGGIIGGIKRIGEVLMDVLLRPVQKLLGWVGELTGWDWAKKAAQWVQEVRVDHNLAEAEKKPEVDPATGKPKAETKKAETRKAAAAGGLGIGTEASQTAAKATSQSGQIKRIDIRIDKVVESFTVHTTNMQQSASDIRDMVARALTDAVNDVNYAL